MKQLKLLALLLTFTCMACSGNTTPPGNSSDSNDVEISVPNTSADPSDPNVATPTGDTEEEGALDNTADGMTQEENEEIAVEEEKGLSAAQTMAIVQQVLFSK